MSDPMRFSLKHHGQLSCVEHCQEGEYVLHSDYASLKAEVERLKEGNDCLGQMHDKEMERSAYLLEEFNRTTAWGRGLESDLSHARVEISFLKAEVERLRKAGDDLSASLTIHSNHPNCGARDEWIRAKKGLPSLAEQWEREKNNNDRAAKEGKPSK